MKAMMKALKARWAALRTTRKIEPQAYTQHRRVPLADPVEEQRRVLAVHAFSMIHMITSGRAKDARTVNRYLDAAAGFIADARAVPTPTGESQP